MITRKRTAFWAIVAFLVMSVTAFGAGQGRRNANQQQQQQQQQPQPERGIVAPQTKDEGDAFNNLVKEKDPAKQVELAEGFVAKYPMSDFIPYAHTYRVTAYQQLGKFKESIGAAEQAIDTTIKLGERLVAKADADSKLTDKDKEAIKKKDKNAVFIDKDSPLFKTFMNQSEQRILAFYQAIIQSYQQLNDAAKMMEWGEKALGFKPDDINTLAMLSNVMAERPPTNEAQMTAQMKKAEEYVNQALTGLPAYLSSPEAANITPQGKSEMTAQLHYTLGLVYLRQKRLGSSEQEFLTAIQSKPNDPVTYYRLGIAYVQEMKNDQAMDALGKSAFLKGVSEAGARDLLKQLYVQKNKSDQGLEDYIKASGTKIGQ